MASPTGGREPRRPSGALSAFLPRSWRTQVTWPEERSPRGTNSPKGGILLVSDEIETRPRCHLQALTPRLC